MYTVRGIRSIALIPQEEYGSGLKKPSPGPQFHIDRCLRSHLDIHLLLAHRRH